MTGVTALPIEPARVSEPLFAALVAESVTVALAFVLPASIVPAAVDCKREAFGAINVKLLAAPEAPFIVMVPVAESEINTF